MSKSLMIKCLLGAVAVLFLIGTTLFIAKRMPSNSSSTESAQSVHTIQATIDKMREDGKLTVSETPLWTTFPRLPQSKHWGSDGERLVWEHNLKYLIEDNLHNLSRPLRTQILLLRDTYEAKGLE